MNRLGFDSLARLRGGDGDAWRLSGAELLMSHFVSSEIPGDPINQAQIERFEAARAAFPSLPASLANSSGMFLSPSPIYDLARPGYALYGGNPTPGGPIRCARRDADGRDPADPLDRGRHDLRLQRPVDRQAPHPARDPAHRLRRRPAARRWRDRFKAGRRSRGRWAPLPAGRARVDGPRHRRRAPTCPRTPVRAGDPVELFGGSIDLDDFASRSGTIGYHLLTSLGPRYQREYVR